MASVLALCFVFYALAFKAELIELEDPSDGPGIIECTHVDTPCIIDCVADDSCSSKELRCHATAEQNCTINLRENDSNGTVNIYTYQSPLVHINCLEYKPTQPWKVNIFAHQRVGAKLYMSLDLGCMHYSTVYAPVGRGSLFSIEAKKHSFQDSTIYHDHTTELYITALGEKPFRFTSILNIFDDDSPLNISRDDSHYLEMDHSYRAPVTLNGNSRLGLGFMAIGGHNHGHWSITGAADAFRDTVFSPTSDLPPCDGVAAYDFNISIDQSQSTSSDYAGWTMLTTSDIGADYNVYVDMAGPFLEKDLQPMELNVRDANSLSVLCHDGANCNRSIISMECPSNDECNIYCDEHNATVCDDMAIADAYGQECGTPSDCDYMTNNPFPPVSLGAVCTWERQVDETPSSTVSLPDEAAANPGSSSNVTTVAIAAGATVGVTVLLVLLGYLYCRGRRRFKRNQAQMFADEAQYAKAATQESALGSTSRPADAPGLVGARTVSVVPGQVPANIDSAAANHDVPVVPDGDPELQLAVVTHRPGRHTMDLRVTQLAITQYEDWTPDQVVDWVVHLNYDAYVRYEPDLRDAFNKNVVNGKALTGLRDVHLEKAGMNGLMDDIHRGHILESIQQLLNGEFSEMVDTEGLAKEEQGQAREGDNETQVHHYVAPDEFEVVADDGEGDPISLGDRQQTREHSDSSIAMHGDHWAVNKVTNFYGADDAHKLEIFHQDENGELKANHAVNGPETDGKI